MEKYNKFLNNLAELIDKGLFVSKDLRKEVQDLLKFKMESVANKLNLVSREEFEVQKEVIKKLQKKFANKNNIKLKKNFKQAKKS